MERKNQGPFRCRNCSAWLYWPKEEKTFLCPYCSQSHESFEEVSSLGPNTSSPQNSIALEKPILDLDKGQYYFPLKIQKAKALDLLQDYVKGRALLPLGLRSGLKKVQNLQGRFFPFYAFCARSWVIFDGQKGIHAWTQSQSKEKNGKIQRKKEKRIRWTRIQGEASRVLEDYLFSTSDPLVEEVRELGPWNFQDIKQAGSQWAEKHRPLAQKHDAHTAWDLFRSKIEDDLIRDIKKKYRALEVRFQDKKVSHTLSKLRLIFVPLWYFPFTHKGRERFLWVNGYNGSIAPDPPKSYLKIALGIFLTIVLLTGAFLFWSAL